MDEKEKNYLEDYDIRNWGSLQDSLSKATGLAIVVIDYRANLITKESGFTPFCNKMINDPRLLTYCEKCAARGGIEAARTKSIFMYLCHFDILEVAIPIIIDDVYVCSLIAGQIKLDDAEQHNKIERIVNFDYQEVLDKEKLNDLYNQIPTYSFEEFQKYVDLLLQTTIFVNQNVLQKADIDFNGSPLTLKNIKEKQQNSILQPALSFIIENKEIMVTQKDAAKLCNLSQGHFSRMFHKEMGDSFSNFYAKLKIEWAKERLFNTDDLISVISYDLGYNEPSYFVKTFKKITGTTPSKMRKLSSKSNIKFK